MSHSIDPLYLFYNGARITNPSGTVLGMGGIYRNYHKPWCRDQVRYEFAAMAEADVGFGACFLWTAWRDDNQDPPGTLGNRKFQNYLQMFRDAQAIGLPTMASLGYSGATVPADRMPGQDPFDVRGRETFMGRRKGDVIHFLRGDPRVVPWDTLGPNQPPTFETYDTDGAQWARMILVALREAGAPPVFFQSNHTHFGQGECNLNPDNPYIELSKRFWVTVLTENADYPGGLGLVTRAYTHPPTGLDWMEPEHFAELEPLVSALLITMRPDWLDQPDLPELLEQMHSLTVYRPWSSTGKIWMHDYGFRYGEDELGQTRAETLHSMLRLGQEMDVRRGMAWRFGERGGHLGLYDGEQWLPGVLETIRRF